MHSRRLAVQRFQVLFECRWPPSRVGKKRSLIKSPLGRLAAKPTKPSLDELRRSSTTGMGSLYNAVDAVIAMGRRHYFVGHSDWPRFATAERTTAWETLPLVWAIIHAATCLDRGCSRLQLAHSSIAPRERRCG